MLPVIQSARPHGARPSTFLFDTIAIPVSIHAPARGATFRFRQNQASQGRFNPRARTGRDKKPLLEIPMRFGFNPRARTGRD